MRQEEVNLRQAPQRDRTASGPALSVGCILIDRFTISALANFIDVLRLAADEGDRSRPIQCRWTIISSDMQPVRSSSGIAVQPHERFGDPARFHYVVVVGGVMEGTNFRDPSIERFLRSCDRVGVALVGLCTGTFILHRAGLMDGYKCCVSWFHYADFRAEFAGIQPVSDKIFVVDRNRLTCSGGANTAHIAAHLVERHLGKAAAEKSLQIMLFDGVHLGDSPQPAPPAFAGVEDALVVKALNLMQQHIEIPLSIQQIADRLEASRRSLERRFQLAVSESPAKAYLGLRLSRAQTLLSIGQKPVSTIALECGFCDASHLGKVMRGHANRGTDHGPRTF